MHTIRIYTSETLDLNVLLRLGASFGEIQHYKELAVQDDSKNVFEIAFFEKEDAESAVKNMDGMQLNNCSLRSIFLHR